jgi:two-component system chemotaxis response regulator CheB
VARGRTARAESAAHAAVRANASLLAASAVVAGLACARPRTAPDRLAAEAASFVRLLGLALRHGTAPAKIDSAVRAEVRAGALAAASPTDVAAVFEVWRRAVHAVLATLAAAEAHRGVRALDDLERRAVRAAESWDRHRVDVVVVGASAGGLDPLATLLAALGSDLPATVICVFHVAPHGPGLLPSILARRARVPIAAASDGAALYLGWAYVAPPGRHLVAGPSGLRLVDGPPVHFVKPSVDVLFESAADAFGKRLASVVLSGSGADGAIGTQAVHERGGLTLAQDPGDSEFDRMPANAIATGQVDRVLPVKQIATALRSAILAGRGSRA